MIDQATEQALDQPPDRVSDPSPLDRALECVARGWYVFPIAPNGKEPHPMLEDEGGERGGHYHATLDIETIKRWWGRDPNANIGISLEPSGLVALDVDKGKGGMESLAEIDSELAGSLTVLTGSGGLHVFYRRTDVSQARRKIGFLPGLDLLGLGYVVAVGSTHACGGKYRWANDAEIVDLPPRLANVFAPAQASTIQGSTSDEPASPTVIAAARNRLIAHGPAIQGQGGDTKTFQVGAILLNDFALSWDQAFPLALEWNTRCVPPWEPSELAGKLRNGERSASGVRGEARSAVEFGEILRAPKDEAVPAEPGSFEHELELARRDVAAALGKSDRKIVRRPLFEDARDILARPPKKARWLVKGLISEGGTAMIGATPKSGKTWIATEVAVAVATGTRAFDEFDTGEARPVACFYAEDDEGAFQSHLGALLKSRGMGSDDLGARFFAQPRGETLDLLDVESLAWIVASVRFKICGPIALLCLDPLRDIHTGVEDSSDSMSVVMRHVRVLGVILGCTVLICHHSAKASENQNKRSGGQRMRGSGAIHGSVDSGLYVARTSDEDKKIIRCRVESEVKAAASAGGFDLTLRMEDNCEGVAERAAWEISRGEDCGKKSGESGDKANVENEKLVAEVLEWHRKGEPKTKRELREIMPSYRTSRPTRYLQKESVPGIVERCLGEKLIRTDLDFSSGQRRVVLVPASAPPPPPSVVDETSVASRWLK